MTEQQPRASFVTVIAWIFIVISSACTLISILQSILVSLLSQELDLAAAQRSDAIPAIPAMPAIQLFLLENFRIVTLVGLLLSGVMLLNSIALLKRRNWARIYFIAVMIVVAAMGIAHFALHPFLYPPARIFAEAGVRNFYYAIIASNAFAAVTLIALSTWVAKRLLSPTIAAEFRG